MKDWKKGDDYPEWYTDESLYTVSKGYILDGETPNLAYARIARSSACYLRRPDLEPIFLEILLKGWLCPASPILSNSGTSRALPISCFGIHVEDSVEGIASATREMMIMTKSGGGVGLGFSDIRGRGSNIKSSGTSQGSIPWMKLIDSAILATAQGNVRRGACSINLRIDHPDILDFLKIREPKGDIERQCHNSNHCVQVTDEFMQRVFSRDSDAMDLWIELLKTRVETGQPYIQYIDTCNSDRPEAYKKLNLYLSMTNICTEISLYCDKDHSFVCDLSSLNLAKWDEIDGYTLPNGMSVPEAAIWFLDGVMEEFILNGRSIKGLEKAVRFASKSRPLGLGVLGWHTFLQKNMIPFCGFQSTSYTHKIFKYIRDESRRASRDLAKIYGTPIWCEGTGMRNTHLNAIAPTTSNSSILGMQSPGIEPIRANSYIFEGAKGSFSIKNPQLALILEDKGKNTRDTWKSIMEHQGSVQHLPFLSDKEKEVFLTFPEINMVKLVAQAGDRQKYLDQTQSLNLCFPTDAKAGYINATHLTAYRRGVHNLYYLRTDSLLVGDSSSKSSYAADLLADCLSCSG